MRKFLIVALLVALVVLVGGALALDGIIAAAVERGGKYALGVDTQLASADASLVGGELELERLEIANTKGFEAPYFLFVDHISVAVSTKSLLGDTIEVPKFELRDVEVHIERTRDGTNYEAILDSLKRFESKTPAEKQAGGGKKFIVRDVLIQNLVVHANVAPGVLGDAGKFSVTIPEIHLKDLGTAEGGQSIGELLGDLVKIVLSAALESGSGIFPEGLLTDLDGALISMGGAILETVRDQIGSGLEHLGKGAENLIEGVGDALDKVFK